METVSLDILHFRVCGTGEWVVLSPAFLGWCNHLQVKNLEFSGVAPECRGAETFADRVNTGIRSWERAIEINMEKLEEKKKGVSDSYGHRYKLLPLLPSGPGGFQKGSWSYETLPQTYKVYRNSARNPMKNRRART